jgi:hypothetical protein
MATSPSLWLRQSVPPVAPAACSSLPLLASGGFDGPVPSLLAFRVLLCRLGLGECGCSCWPISRGQRIGRLACWPVVLTPSRLGGFPFYLSDPLVHEIAMVLRFLVGVMEVRHHETLPCQGVHKLKSGALIGPGSIPITIADGPTSSSVRGHPKRTTQPP